MNLSDVIQWRWAGAQCVVRGNTLDRWDGPMPCPTEDEFAAALADYASQQVEALVQLRAERTRRLSGSDWTQLRDSSSPDGWVSYRQALRDMPQTTVDPAHPVWPKIPRGTGVD